MPKGRTKLPKMCHFTQFHIKIVLLFVAVFFEFSQAEQPQCESLSKVAPELYKICGYNFTARFRHDKHLDSAIRAVKSMTALLGNCSDFMNVMICSLFVPRCSEEIRGPYLPCRDVCYEYASKCQGVIREKGLQWTVAMCDILAEKDDSQTTKGYRGRCFKPQTFKEGGHEYKHPCSELVISACQGIPGFTHTVVSEDLQRKYGKFIEKIIGNFSADPKCGEMRKQIVCAENMPACLNGTAGFLCRKRCENFFNQCKSPFFYGRDMCMEFPDKDNYTDDSPICKQTHWPRYGNWPSPEPTTIPTRLVTSTTITVNDGTTTKEPPKTSNTIQPGKPGEQKSEGSSSTKILAGTLVAVFLILIIVFGILLFLFFKRKRSRQFGYQKQVFYSDHRAEDDFIVDT